ncbi:hypothetical protein N8Z45_00480 [bacterium]|nr:hypothetical protein [bacterium]
MKKLILTTFAILIAIVSVNAQEIADHAIGLRIADNNGFGTEITYQRALSGNNRLELDLGWRSYNSENGFKLAGIYQWVWELEGDFNWYAGAGGGIGSVNKAFVFVAGNVGIEYNFDIPLQLSLDFRPEINLGNVFDDNLGFDVGLGIRYKF